MEGFCVELVDDAGNLESLAIDDCGVLATIAWILYPIKSVPFPMTTKDDVEAPVVDVVNGGGGEGGDVEDDEDACEGE